MPTDQDTFKWSQRKKLGEMLIDAGLITPAQLTHALEEKKKNRDVKLGEMLVRLRIATEEQIASAVSEQLGIDIYEPQNYPPDSSLSALVPETLAYAQELAPLQKTDKLLKVAIPDPTNLVALDSVTDVTRMDVEPVICTQKELQSIQQAVYGKESAARERALLEGLSDIDLQTEAAEAEEEPRGVSDNYLISMAEDAPVVRLANSILVQALNRGASDIHLSPQRDNVQLRFRVDGELSDILAPPKSVFLPLLSRLKLLSHMDISVTRIPQDGRFSFRTESREVSVRASTLPTVHGEKMVMRLLDQSKGPISLGKLGLRTEDQAKIENAISQSYGMILATGPTGSGKTTLLYSLLDRVNRSNLNIVTLEDPVEYQLPGVAQAQLNRKAGMTFASGLRAILRQDPDVIMVGEIRDVETATIAVESAMTGHKLLSTLHTNDSPGAITRFQEMGIEPFLISSTLLVAVAQRLLRRLCEECLEPIPASKEALRVLGLPEPFPKNLRLFKAKGCPTCGKTGYQGRIGVYEVLEINDMVRGLILSRASSTEIKQATVEAGHLRTLQADAAAKVLDGITSFEEFFKVRSGA